MLQKKAIGLDIADHSIEIIQLEQSLFSSMQRIVVRARMSLEPGIVEQGRITLRKQLAQALDDLLSRVAPRPIILRDIVFGLPERQVYTSVIHVRAEKGISLQQQIDQAVRESIPLEADDLIVSSHVISQREHTFEVLFYGASKEVVIEWYDFFQSAGIRVLAIDHELLAIARGLFGRHVPFPTCVVDIGAERTKVAVFSPTGLHYVHAIEIAGDFFTSEIAKSFEVSLEEAEKIKKEKGIEPIAHRALFDKLLKPIIKEILLACDFFEKQQKGGIVQEILLVGGSARLKGLYEYIKEQTNRYCKQGSPFIHLLGIGDDQDQLHYIESIGLALKGIDRRYWEREHPSFSLVGLSTPQ